MTAARHDATSRQSPPSPLHTTIRQWRKNRLRHPWRSQRGGIDSTMLAAGLLLTFVLCITLAWPLWHVFGLRAELARSLHMANRAAVGAFDRAAWTQSQVLTLSGAEERVRESLTVSLGLDAAGYLPEPQPLASGPVQVVVTLEPAPGADPGSDLLASRAVLTVPVETFGQHWTLRVTDVHYLHLSD